MSAATSALTETEITEKWATYKTEFGKNYPDEKEEQMRKKLFTETLKFIEEHNKKYERGEVTFTVGLNHFADLTPEEKRPYSHGVLRPTTDKSEK
ncbi:hypothetical protein Zmor_020145 [Zophobas morio]|uniref:Cathepsin propeptide inhibitor domain-containing protein n=1 Tax=Zophobas morio TaxID=2755281 RepID=A0AA38I3H8_9CUCU|nr:hypothetical protein Zmor_020145 [Zophobas morio]